MEVYITDSQSVFVRSETIDPIGAIPRGSVMTAPPTITVGQFARWTGNTWEVLSTYPPIPAPIITIPQEVTRRQVKLALNQMGLLVTVETTITNSTDTALKIDWAEASTFRRDWDSLIAMATSLGMTSVQIDDLFILAATL